MSRAEGTVVFDEDLVDLFASVSHDRNPLHVSMEYARATPFGGRVVHGVLGALGVLARLPDVALAGTARIELDFRAPILIGHEHRVEVSTERWGWAGKLLRSGRTVLRLMVRSESKGHLGGALTPTAKRPLGPRREPACASLADLRPEQEHGGTYGIAAEPLATLLTKLGFATGTACATRLVPLLWSSYLVGMEIPGRQALFSRLELELRPGAPARLDSLAWGAKVELIDPRFRLVDIVGVLEADGVRAVDARIRAFVRTERQPASVEQIGSALRDVARLDGRVAVVIGASRGLGATVAIALARQGCAVTGCYQVSTTRAQRVEKEAAALEGSVTMLRGDAGDPAWCAELVDAVEARHGRIDTLVCCASPPLLPLRLSGESSTELAEFVAQSLRLVATPIAAHLSTLSRNGGQVVVVSSAALEAPPAEWAHYVTAKGAVERLVEVLERSYPRIRFHVVRPPALDTEYQDSFAAEPDRVSTTVIAADILRSITGGAVQEGAHGGAR